MSASSQIPSKAAQIPLNLPAAPDYRESRFIKARSNAEAHKALQYGQAWPNDALAIIGPKGSGKTHLGHIWANNNQALVLSPDDFPNTDFALEALPGWKGRHIWLDRASLAPEPVLFALINMAIAGDIKALLLTDRRPPADWPMQIPDLRSRLKSLYVTRVQEPDDALLDAIFQKLFLDRGLKVSGALIKYLVMRTERSVDAAYAIVDHLDKMSAAEKVNVTRSFAARIFDDI